MLDMKLTSICSTGIMITIHTVIILASIFEHHLYVVKPPEVGKADVAFHYGNAKLEWSSMDSKTIEGIDLFKQELPKNLSSLDIINFKIRFYAKNITRDSSLQTFWNTEKTYIPPATIVCEKTLFVSSFVLCFLLIVEIYVIYFYKVCSK